MKAGKTGKTLLSLAFMAVVAYLLSQSLANIEWSEVQRALGKVSWRVLLPCFLAAILNYIILASFDFLGLKYLKLSSLSYPKVLASALVSYIFNLNLGALVGGLAFRFRIYSGWNVPKKKIPLIFVFSTISNWLGYTLLLAILCFFYSTEVGKLLHLSGPWIFAMGVAGLLIVALYFLGCFKRIELKLRGKEMQLPPVKIALFQLLLALMQWCLLSGILFYILHGLDAPVAYAEVLVTYLLASIAGVITHIPGGLGVLETVFLRMDLGVAKSDLLVALLSFRAVYYLFPLLLALPGYLALEYYQKITTRRHEHPLGS